MVDIFSNGNEDLIVWELLDEMSEPVLPILSAYIESCNIFKRNSHGKSLCFRHMGSTKERVGGED